MAMTLGLSSIVFKPSITLVTLRPKSSLGNILQALDPSLKTASNLSLCEEHVMKLGFLKSFLWPLPETKRHM